MTTLRVEVNERGCAALSGRLLLVFLLLGLSGALLRLVPERAGTLAEMTPTAPLFYFEIHPQSTSLTAPAEGLLAELGEDQQWIGDALKKVSPQDQPLLQQLCADPETRLAVSVANPRREASDDIRIDFLAVARTSQARFRSLVNLVEGVISRAIPPAHYIEMQQSPRLGVIVGEPPRRLYIYQESPLYLVSNSRDLMLEALAIRYRGHPALARQHDYQKLRRAMTGSNGALLYVNLRSLADGPGLDKAAPFIAALGAFNLDLQVLGYQWDYVRGQVVRRAILIEGATVR